MPDYIFENHHSIWLCQPMNDAARAWLEENTDTETQWWADALVVEPRYVSNLAFALECDSYTVQL